MENEEYGYKVAKKFIMKGWLTFSKRLFSFPYSALRTPHSALRTPHSALRTPIFHPTEIILFAREMWALKSEMRRLAKHAVNERYRSSQNANTDFVGRDVFSVGGWQFQGQITLFRRLTKEFCMQKSFSKKDKKSASATVRQRVRFVEYRFYRH